MITIFDQFNKTKLDVDMEALEKDFETGKEEIAFIHYEYDNDPENYEPEDYKGIIINPWNPDVKIEIQANIEEGDRLENYLYDQYRSNKTIMEVIEEIKESGNYEIMVSKILSTLDIEDED